MTATGSNAATTATTKAATVKARLCALVLSGIAALTAAIALGMPAQAFAADNGIPDKYDPPFFNSIPHVQFKNVFETGTVQVSGIKVNVDSYFGDASDTVHFRIFNTTTQETEYEVDTVNDGAGNNTLPDMQLKRGHDYIFFVEDKHYQAKPNTYVQILAGSEKHAGDGPGAYNYMTQNLQYTKLSQIDVKRRSVECADPFADNRFDTGSTQTQPIYVYYKGAKVSGVKLRLVSDRETLTATVGSDGRLKVRLIEGVTYMVYVDSDKYVVDPFPIVAKDKTEYGEGLFCYNHTNCVQVKSITLYDKGETSFDGLTRTTTLKSLKGRTTVSGMNFKSLLILDRVLDSKVAAMNGREYDVVGITAVNPRRWEISKLVGNTFTVAQKVRTDRLVGHVYRLEGEKLRELSFTQPAPGSVSFKTDSLSLYPFVIEYASVRTTKPKITISKPSYVYSGKTVTPTVAVKDGSTALFSDYYEVTLPAGRKNVGVYKVTVKLKGAYAGSGSASFKINPKGAALKTVKAGKKSIAVTWKKQAAQTTGYQIQYSTSKNFKKGVKALTVKGPKKTKATIKKLKSGKRYYVKIRTYKKVGKATYYSAWSKVKSTKAK